MSSFYTPDYSQYSTSDFVLDESFRRWVLQPDEQTMSFWHTFMLRYPDQQAIINEASSILLHLRVRHDDLAHASQERIWQVLEAAYDRQPLPNDQQANRPNSFLKKFVNYPFRNWRVAASLTGLLLLAGGGWAWKQYWKRQEVHTSYGEQLSVTLPDGSLVRLNGNSTLIYPNNWQEQGDREVWLEGEAFFNVAKKKSPAGRLKFITHTPNLDISVLGTQFNVNTRRGNTLVVLAEGKVELSKPNDKKAHVIRMKPGDLAMAQAGIEQVAIQPSKPQLHTAWIKNQFAFDNIPLREIAQQLNDTWGVTLIFEDNALADRRFTGNLSSQDLETLITTLATTFDLEADRKGNEIYLRRP
ncbi:FecR family protein [Spirosoma sp. KNUC1025]|uniref:FecR family protein n=1 Tax=Spirosoma sp. KNUC1025 TaxID=2894082 RepID=UPI0038632FF3|nr:FecR domain-containing protein [Spirosoma sp. KNUC1025]